MTQEASIKLDKIRNQIEKIDLGLLKLLVQRMNLAKEIEKYKENCGNQSIIQHFVEHEKLDRLKEWAKDNELNPLFIEALFYLIITESCRVQIEQFQLASNKLK